MSNRITEVRLLSVPLENDYKHTFAFSTPVQQQGAFINRTKHIMTECSYQRKDGYISFDGYIEDLRDSNYVMYKNRDGEWIYAFITRMEYKSDSVTWIYIETDVIQTYMFKYSLRPSFVEREHCSDDTVGLHTVPEQLECGEFVCKYQEHNSDLQKLRVVVGVSEALSDNNQIQFVTLGKVLHGVYNSLDHYSYDIDDTSFMSTLFKLYEAGKIDAIQYVFLAPEFISKNWKDGMSPTPEVDEARHHILSEGVTPGNLEQKINKSIIKNSYRINGYNYQIKNNKLKCFPYQYLNVSNNNGASAQYHFEHFEGDEMKFDIKGALTPGCSIRLIPKNYKGVDFCNEEGLNLGKYPICNWTSDVYTNWLTQNSVNIGLQIASGATQVIAGALITAGTGGLGGVIGGGTIAGGVGQIANTIGQIHQMSFTPDQARGNLNCGDVTCGMKYNTFSFYGMTIKDEYFRILDDFFTMFGYKTNQVKVPSSFHRKSFWFTKTIDAFVEGEIEREHLNKIRECYDKGITFWNVGVNFNNMGDYSLDNSIV